MNPRKQKLLFFIMAIVTVIATSVLFNIEPVIGANTPKVVHCKGSYPVKPPYPVRTVTMPYPVKLASYPAVTQTPDGADWCAFLPYAGKGILGQATATRTPTATATRTPTATATRTSTATRAVTATQVAYP